MGRLAFGVAGVEAGTGADRSGIECLIGGLGESWCRV